MINHRNEIAFLKNQLSKIEVELKNSPPGHMEITRNGKYTKYVHICRENGNCFRRGIGKEHEIIQQLARKKYLLCFAERLRKNIQAYEEFLETYSEVTPDDVYNELPKALRALPKEYIFQKAEYDGDRMLNPLLVSMSDELISWEKLDYERAAFRANERTQKTSQGLLVRSKSEMLIAETLYDYNLPFHYEEVVHIGEKTVLPDFTIRNRSGKKYFWEHCGLTNDSSYMRRHRDKIELYERAGITEWNNLIVTYDDENGNLDLSVINGIIKTIILPTGNID